MKQLFEIFEVRSKPFHVFLVLGSTLLSASVIAVIFFLIGWLYFGNFTPFSSATILTIVAFGFLYTLYSLLKSNYQKRNFAACQSYVQAILLVLVLYVILFIQLLIA